MHNVCSLTPSSDDLAPSSLILLSSTLKELAGAGSCLFAPSEHFEQAHIVHLVQQ